MKPVQQSGLRTDVLRSASRSTLKLLKRISVNRSALGAVARNSYEHYNGFDKIVIRKDAAGSELRLHVWWPDPGELHYENIHNHRWAFTSVVLAGAYDYELYEPSEHGTYDALEYEYRSRENLTSYAMQFVGKQRLQCTGKGCYRRNQSYSLRGVTLHRIIPDQSQTTITLMFQGIPRTQSARVFTDPGFEHPVSIPSQGLSNKALARRLDQVISELESLSRCPTEGGRLQAPRCQSKEVPVSSVRKQSCCELDPKLLDANPLENIENTRRIAGVVVGGHYLDDTDLRLMPSEIEETVKRN